MDDLKVVEAKPPLINQHCVVYKFACNLCDADYVGLRNALHQEHKAKTQHTIRLRPCQTVYLN